MSRNRSDPSAYDPVSCRFVVPAFGVVQPHGYDAISSECASIPSRTVLADDELRVRPISVARIPSGAKSVRWTRTPSAAW
jgi:hypothetical protein